MIRIDYMGPIKPYGKNRYVIIIINYFLRYVWAKAVPRATRKYALQLLMEIAQAFGLPRSVYSNNGSYFVEGVFAAYLRSWGIQHYPAPKTYPSLVDLSKRYVQMILYGICKQKFDKMDLSIWDALLEGVIQP
jgi:hypothetical protein